MRSTSLLRLVVGIRQARVTRVLIEDRGLVACVRPQWRRPRCSLCGRKASEGHLQTQGRRWRHLDVSGVKLFLCCDVRRVHCRRCGLQTELMPWARDPRARSTEDFDLEVAYLTQRMSKSDVQRYMRVSWRTVGRCVERVMNRYDLDDPLENLEQIGVDEVSHQKGHRYVTLVADLDRGCVVWGKAGKKAATLEAFIDDLGPERVANLKTACTDMSKAYTTVVDHRLPHVTHVYDRFHVQALVTVAPDRTRQGQWLGRRGSRLRGTRWALLKNPTTLTEAQQTCLAEIQRDNKELYRAYLLKEQFREILDRRQPNVARALLYKWCDWASRSRLPDFVHVSRTIERHMDKIVA